MIWYLKRRVRANKVPKVPKATVAHFFWMKHSLTIAFFCALVFSRWSLKEVPFLRKLLRVYVFSFLSLFVIQWKQVFALSCQHVWCLDQKKVLAKCLWYQHYFHSFGQSLRCLLQQPSNFVVNFSGYSPFSELQGRGVCDAWATRFHRGFW